MDVDSLGIVPSINTYLFQSRGRCYMSRFTDRLAYLLVIFIIVFVIGKYTARAEIQNDSLMQLQETIDSYPACTSELHSLMKEMNYALQEELELKERLLEDRKGYKYGSLFMFIAALLILGLDYLVLKYGETRLRKN